MSVRLAVSLSATLAAFALVEVAPARADPVIAAAGDIACEPGSRYFNDGLGTSTRCRAKHTSDLLLDAGLAAVLPLGDNQYGAGSLSAFLHSYDLSWGRVKSISHPVAGNREYRTPDARGYFDYFNGPGVASGPAGDRNKGYYSYSIGGWHVIALNSNCDKVGCGAGSAQERWLRTDLATHPGRCSLAYWHHPRFSSNRDGSYVSTQQFWSMLYAAGTDVVISASGHAYERFAPLDRNGRVELATGVREFVVGTGGKSHTSFASARAGSEIRDDATFGVLKLSLHPTSYEWQFVPEAGSAFSDRGTGLCHGPPTHTISPDSDQGATCTIVGTAADDVINGTPARDVICGLAGDDELRGAGGNDVLLGGDGDDRLFGDSGRDRVQGNAGDDRMDGGRGSDTLLGGTGRDRINCGTGRDHAYGKAGNDRIRGAGGRDVILGGTGKDRIKGGTGRDRLYGNAGRDILRGASGNDRLVGDAGRDRLYGNAGNDRLSALDNRRRDRVDGGKGRDRASIDKGDRVRRVERVVRS